VTAPSVPRKTALCLCPDAAYFRPAIYTIASLVAAGDADAFDIFVVCESADVAAGFELLDERLARRIRLLRVEFAPHLGALTGQGRFPATVFRRLFLDALLPDNYERIVYLDSDMRIAREGLSRLTGLDLEGAPFAAALDMIYLMDFRGDALARRFQRHRLSLGLAPETPYFNSGLLVIDRQAWRARDVTRRVVETVADDPRRFLFPEQDALNHLFAREFAALSPRYNFMGDFFLLGLEAVWRPVVLHFVNQPKPWRYAEWRGEARFALDYQHWFSVSPWPEWGEPATLERARKTTRSSRARREFARSLQAFLETRKFQDRD